MSGGTARDDQRFFQLELGSWDEARDVSAHFAGAHWRFRGHASADWPLQTTLERAALGYRCKIGDADGRLHGLIDVERRVLTNFRRRAHLYYPGIQQVFFPANRVPGAFRHPYLDTSPIEWLALLQHHGGPTRLLDFSKSFWVAVFFAIEPKANPGPSKNPVVWAVNEDKLWNATASSLLRGTDGDVSDMKMHERRSLAIFLCRQAIMLNDDWCPGHHAQLRHAVLPVEPERINLRMNAQQGCFVFPTDVSRHFMENLLHSFGVDEKVPRLEGTAVDALGRDLRQASLLKIVLPPGREYESCGDQQWRECVHEGMQLLAGMNITRGSLFPDLDGAAQQDFGDVFQ